MKSMKGAQFSNQMFNLLIIGVFALVAISLYSSGVLRGIGLVPASLTGGTLNPANPSQTVLITSAGSGCSSTGLTDIRTTVKDGVVPATGAIQITGTMSYYNDGQSTPFEATALSSTSAASSTNDPACGVNAKIFGVYTNASYYSFKTATETVGQVSVLDVTGSADLIGAASITERNASTLGVSNVNITMGASETNTDVVLTVKETTSRGVFGEAGKVLLCATYNTANFSQVSPASGWNKVSVPSGVCVGAQEAWEGVLNLKDYSQADISMLVKAQSGVNPTYTPITLTLVDYGTFTKNVNGVLYNGYQNDDTLADVGATNVAATIYVS